MTDEQERITRLIPEGLTKSTTLKEAYMLMMKEVEGKRHLPLLINRQEYDLLLECLSKGTYPGTDMMARLAAAFAIMLDGVAIHRDSKGRFFTTLHFTQAQENGTKFNIQTVRSDIAHGIIAAMRTECDIWISQTLFDTLYGKHPDGGQMAVPITSMSCDLLREALRLAVENDDFEIASVLRDELKNRDGAEPHTP